MFRSGIFVIIMQLYLMSINALAADSQNPTNEDNKRQEFIDKEVRMLLLPDDDVMLGEITEDADLEYMDAKNYIKIFAENHDYWAREKDRKKMADFIRNYDKFKKYQKVPN
jgi:hypothetical protein